MIFRRARKTRSYGDTSGHGGVLHRLGRELRLAVQDWHEDRDTFAIKRALSRLSDRRLQLIGLCRQTLEDDIRRMIWDTQDSRTIHAEVLQILDEADRPGRISDTQSRPLPRQITMTGRAAQLDTV